MNKDRSFNQSYWKLVKKEFLFSKVKKNFWMLSWVNQKKKKCPRWTILYKSCDVVDQEDVSQRLMYSTVCWPKKLVIHRNYLFFVCWSATRYNFTVIIIFLLFFKNNSHLLGNNFRYKDWCLKFGKNQLRYKMSWINVWNKVNNFHIGFLKIDLRQTKHLMKVFIIS